VGNFQQKQLSRAPSNTGDTRVVCSWPTPRSAAVHHQRAQARYTVWTGTSQTTVTRRGIPRHETTHWQIVLDIDANTCAYTRLKITVFVRIKTVQHAFSTGCAVRALLSKRFDGVVSRTHGRYGPMYKEHSTHTEFVERRICSGDASLSCTSVTFAFTRCVFCNNQ